MHVNVNYYSPLLQEKMEVCKLYFILVAIIFRTFSKMAAADDFDNARQKINQAKPNIDYDTFCTERKAGEDKIACRIKDVPTVGFLVCKTPVLEEVNCNVVIGNEVGNIGKVSEGNVKTVKISPPPINGVKCGNDSSPSCSGFLEEWIAPERGRFEQVRDHIAGNTVPKLIADVKSFTTSGLTNTVADLKNIKNYMMLNPAEKKYRQICDLQGFFLASGGFLVADVPAIEDTAIDENCWDGEPTTQQVLDALDKMITAFSPSVQSNEALFRTGPYVSILMLLICLHMFLQVIVGRI